jgi:hypothetical protein
VKGAALALGAAVAPVAVAAAMPVPVPVGVGAAFHPGIANAGALRGAPVRGLACTAAETARHGAHLELFAGGRVVIVPSGIGMAAPLRRDGAYVRGGRCSYPLRTREPTGVVEIAPGRRLTLGDLFALWGQSLGPRRLAGFRAAAGAAIRATVDGRPWRGDPRAIPLVRHAQIVLQVGPPVPAHPAYRFPKGL